MALTLRKKSQNYTLDQGATFEKTVTAESPSSVAVDISSGTVTGGIIKNYKFANTLQTFTTSISGTDCTFSLTAAQTAQIEEGKYFYDLLYTQSDGTTKEIMLQGVITVRPTTAVENS